MSAGGAQTSNNPPQTLCFHTRDAVVRDDSSFTFEMPSGRLRAGASRVVLASCEFPMVQWTIEEDFQRFWINEGVRLSDHDDARLRLTIDERDVAVVALPIVLQRVAHVREGGIVECDAAHHLWASATGEKLFDADARLLCATREIALDDAKPVSERAFSIPSLAADDQPLYVWVPTIPSIAALCARLTRAAASVTAASLRFSYDATEDRVRVRASGGKPGTTLRIEPDSLAMHLGLSRAPVRLEASSGSATWPSEPTTLWDYVEMPPGFYAPCHRPMCIGQPLRFGNELESAVNRLYFPLASMDRVPAEAGSPHLLIFADQDGRTRSVPVPCGRYDPTRLCVHLETSMQRVAGNAYSFSVVHEDDRFVFSCEQRLANGTVVPAPFSLLFHHPLSLDPSRFGFEAQPLSGSHTYVAPHRTRIAQFDGMAMNNLLRVSEAGAQKRLRVHAAPMPALVGIFVDRDEMTVRLRTQLNKMPFAHGYRVGDVVRISPTEDAVGVWNGEDAPPASVVPARYVVSSGDDDDDDPCILRLVAPRFEGPGAVQITSVPEPFNMCFCKPRTLPPHLVGFPPRSVQFGIDGSVNDGAGVMLPPFEAPHVHCLDHPDYVLLTFSEQSGASMSHTHAGETRDIFAKLSLYPLFREERNLSRDTLLLGSKVLRFTLQFWNPDLKTPYRFHGSEFSFSLTFVPSM